MKKKAAQATVLPEKRDWLNGRRPYFILALLCILLYIPTLWYDFSPLDERWLIIKQLGAMSDIGNLPVLFKSPIIGMYYRPVLMSSFMFDAIAGGGGPGIFHFTNIIIHTLCTLLLYRFLRQLNLSKVTACMCAAIFAVHPLNIHAVAWIPGRNDSLLCLFALLSCIQLLNYFSTGKKIHLAVHIFAFALALLTKENAIVLPLIYFMLCLFKIEKYKPELLITVICWVIFVVGWFFLRMNFVTYLPIKSSASFGQNIFFFLQGLIIFSGKAFLPFQQSVMSTLKDSAIIPYLVIVIIITALAIKFKFHDRKIAFFGLVWFFGFLLLPVWFGATNSNHDISEHRVYTSLIGMFLFVTQLKITLRPVFIQRGFLLVLILFSIRTFSRCPVYKNEASFLEAGVAESPSMPLMHDMLGFKYTGTKDYTKAREYFDEAIRLNPRHEYYNHRGNLHYLAKNYKLALEDFNKTLAINDTDAATYANRSMTNFYLGNNAAALADFNSARKIGAKSFPPDFAQALFEALQTDTIVFYTKKLQTDSLDAPAYNSRGIARMRLSLYKEALEDFNRALDLRPDSDVYRANQKLALSNLNQKKR